MNQEKEAPSIIVTQVTEIAPDLVQNAEKIGEHSVNKISNEDHVAIDANSANQTKPDLRLRFSEST